MKKKAAGPNKGMNPKTKIALSVTIGIVAVLLIVALIVSYILLIESKLFDTRVENMNELAEHDATTIEEYIDSTWESLETIADEVVMNDPATLQDMIEYLNIQRAAGDFNKLYVMTRTTANSKVVMYSDTFKVTREEDNSFLDYANIDIINKTPARFVIKYLREDTYLEDKVDALYYGVMLNNDIESNKLYIYDGDGDVEVVCIMARMDLTSIQERIKINCYGDKGYTSVIDVNGDYIVNPNGITGLGDRYNYIDNLEKAKLEKGVSVDNIKKAIQNNESFEITFTDANGVEKVAKSVELDSVDWTVVMTVEKSVFDNQAKNIIVLTTIFMLSIGFSFLIIIFILVLAIMKGVNTSAEVKARNDFMAIMSHEIRTPLNAIIGYNRLARMNINDKDKLKDYMQKEADTSDYLLGLLNDILDVSALKDSQFQLDEKPASIEAIIYSVIAMQRSTIQKKGLNFGAKKNLISPYVICDEQRVKQVVMNILSNACKFTEHGQIFMTVMQEKVGEDKVKTIFKISDTGCGMSKEMMDVIFDAFSQDRESNTMCLKGTGLGMTIGKLIMDSMGGDITVQSELNKGSTFTIQFTAQLCTNEQIYEYKKSLHTISNDDPTRKMHVFVVEDNELNTEILTEILQAENFDVTVAENGQVAVDKFAESRYGEFDVVLMDIRMPVMDGFEATKQIRALDRDDAKTVPIFACTANAFKEDENKAYECGMDDFLTKPIDIAQMLTKLQELNGKKRNK